MIERIKNVKQKSIVKQLFSLKRMKIIHSFDSVKTIGIVVDITTEEDWKQLSNITKKFEKIGKKVYILARKNDKEKSDTKSDFIITDTNVLILHTKTDFNFWGIPKPFTLKSFFDRKYDILIDMTPNNGDFFPIYVALHALSDLRISRSNDDDENKKIYDLLLKMSPNDSNCDFLEQVVRYLNMVNK